MNITNCSSTFEHTTPVVKIVMPIFNSVQTLLTIIGNFLVIWLYYRNKKLRTPANTILLNLCIVDLLYIKIFVAKTLILLTPDHENEEFCSKLSKFYKVVITVTQVYLVLISIDRLMAIKYPLKYMEWVTTKRVIILSTIMWVIIAGFFIDHLVRELVDEKFWRGMSRCRHRHYKRGHKVNSSRVLIRSFAYFIPFTFIVVSYSISFYIALSQVKQIYPLTEQDMRRRSAFKAVRTTAILIGTYFVMYTPGYLLTAVHTLTDKGNCPTEVGYHAREILTYVSIMGAWVNPLVYTLTCADFKLAVKKLWRRNAQEQPK